MSFNGSEGDFISLIDAADLTANYRSANSSNPKLILGHFLGKSKLQDLLAQSDCMGLRIYYGINTSPITAEIVVVGVDSNEDDILASSGPLILDFAVPCPPTCGSTNALNS